MFTNNCNNRLFLKIDLSLLSISLITIVNAALYFKLIWLVKSTALNNFKM